VHDRPRESPPQALLEVDHGAYAITHQRVSRVDELWIATRVDDQDGPHGGLHALGVASR
jgi:hypothetical protein